MKKVIKIFFMILILAVISGYIYLMSINNKDIEGTEYNNFKIGWGASKVQEFTFSKENKNLFINGDDFKVIFKEYDGDSIRITGEVGEGKNIFIVENNEKNINIERKLDFDIFNIFNFNFYTDNILVEVPKDLKIKLEGNISNGRGEFTGIDFEEVTFETSNSKILLNDIQIDNKGSFVSNNAAIECNKIEGNIVSIKTSNGKLKIKDVKGKEITMKTSNNSVDCENIFVNNVEIKTSNGDISIDNGDSNFEIDKLITDTSNGDKDINAYVKKQGRN